MGKNFSSLFETQCYYCKGTGYEPSNQIAYCGICHGTMYISIFNLHNLPKWVRLKTKKRGYETFDNSLIR